jgi:monoamine oxidase
VYPLKAFRGGSGESMRRRDFLKQVALTGAAAFALPLNTIAFGQTLARNGAPKRVIIIGAGLAGLSAAFELTQAGHDVTILEAQTRAGGRVHTLRDEFAEGLYAEAGATRIPNNHHLTLRYTELFGLTLDPFQPPDVPNVYYVRERRMMVKPGEETVWPYGLTPEERKMGLSGMREKYIYSVFSELGDVTDPRWPPEALKKYDQMNRSDFWRSRGASEEAINLLSLGGFDDRAETVSALFMLRNAALHQKVTRYYKIRGGNDLLPKAFASRLAEKIRYGAPVVRIEHDARGVKAVFLHANSPQTVTAEYLICAVPFTVQRNIEVSPAFSVEKQRAIEQLPYHSVSKIFLQSRTKFWVEDGLSGFATTDLPIREIWDMTYMQPGTRGILQAYPMSLHSRRVTAMSEPERLSLTLEQVERIYPGMRESFEGGISKCWDTDEWARGATSFYKPGQISSLLPHVARPERRVYFAGEHTSVWIDGWMQGAIESGLRVAKEVNDAT